MSEIICKKCGIPKNEEEFYLNRTSIYAYRKTTCKICENETKRRGYIRKTPKPRVKHFKFTDEEIVSAVAKSVSIRETAFVLGISLHGGSLGNLKKRLLGLNLDLSHFTGQKGNKGKGCGKKLPACVRLVLRPAGSNREKGHILRRCLIEIGREYRCETCGQLPVWNGQPLRLEVDHKNGICWDDRPDNIQFICGHCHSQTPTYKAKNKGRDARAGY